jgi:N-acetylmuramoyl-L-alanine amidase
MKYLSVILVLCLTLSLAGCFGGEGAGETTPTTVATTAVTTTVPTTAGTTATVYPFTGYINASTLNVRPTPDINGYPIGGLKFGDTVTVTGREGDWYAISFGAGMGYVNAQYVQDTVPVPTVTITAPTTTETSVDTTTTTAELVSP